MQLPPQAYHHLVRCLSIWFLHISIYRNTANVCNTWKKPDQTMSWEQRLELGKHDKKRACPLYKESCIALHHYLSQVHWERRVRMGGIGKEAPSVFGTVVSDVQWSGCWWLLGALVVRGCTLSCLCFGRIQTCIASLEAGLFVLATAIESAELFGPGLQSKANRDSRSLVSQAPNHSCG